MKLQFTIKLPVAADDLGRWLEAHGGCITMHCMLGTWHVTVGQKKLLSYSDAHGEHSEHWEVSRYDRNLMTALEEALRAAGAIIDEKNIESFVRVNRTERIP